MAGSQSSSMLVILCLILAALMGSARGQDTASPAADAPIVSPDTAAAPAPDAGAPVPAPETAEAPTPDAAEAPAPDTAQAPSSDAAEAPAPDTAEAPAPDAAEAPAPAPQADAAAAPAPGPGVDIASTTSTAYRSGPPPNCVQEAFGLAGNNAPCQSLVNSFRGSLGSNPSMDDASLDAAVSKAGTISSQCCNVVRTFIQDGCTCDSQLLNLLPMVGASANQMNFVAKASQRSSCAGSQYGGYFSNPCDSSGSSNSATAGRRLFMQAPVVA